MGIWFFECVSSITTITTTSNNKKGPLKYKTRIIKTTKNIFDCYSINNSIIIIIILIAAIQNVIKTSKLNFIKLTNKQNMKKIT